VFELPKGAVPLDIEAEGLVVGAAILVFLTWGAAGRLATGFEAWDLACSVAFFAFFAFCT
jgi:hypothetical protein